MTPLDCGSIPQSGHTSLSVTVVGAVHMHIPKWSTVPLLMPCLIGVLLLSCTGDSDDESFSTISSSGRIIVVDELLATPFKKLREYETDGLPGATAVLHGFLRTDSDAYDYEVRFYQNHTQAVDLGTALAEEGSGPNAVIKESDAAYKKGIRDRRVVIGGLEGAIEAGSVGPKYGGYVTYENLIVLCQGSNLEQSLERCNLLTSALESPE